MLQSFKMALRSIWGNKMRSFLTMLGIIIGVASVIILVSVVNAYMSTVVESFASMGVNQMSVRLTNTPTRSVSDDEMYEFYEENRDKFAQMSPQVTVSTVVKHGSDSLSSTSVGGYSEEYLDLMGYFVANELYGGPEKALGETLKIGGYAFKIVGVVKRQDEDDLEEGGSDDFVWIPYSVAVKMSRNADINQYVFATEKVEETERCKALLEEFFLETFKNDSLYRITANSEMVDSLNEQIAMMSAMLGGIAGISLLVAGVGVMNIMLVSVTERTREIGIRKSLGARRKVIMEQFVIEAAVTSSIGGIMGILLGAAATRLVGAAMGITANPTLGAVIISFSVSVGIGLLFGYMPASRAARLNPIDALRSE